MKETTRSPWVQVSISEYDVRNMKEVLVGVAPTKCVKGPIKLRVQPIFFFAVFYELISVPKVTREHVSHSVWLNGNHHLIAYLVAPSVVIEPWCFLFLFQWDICAVDHPRGVLENVEDYLEAPDIVHVSGSCADVAIHPVDSGINRVGWERP